ncbi:MAG TPA: adenylate/guanylate cyclase domain-containing protein [Mycobacteriales bacterium]|nr:adenylate/guanylate cyclase domain-containing protein [Mycobacteriales bacterium]
MPPVRQAVADPYLPYVSRIPLSFEDSDGPAAHWLDGTLLFVDVAGFTALSERLGRTGRAGAEELTELLDGAFARLLAAAYENGGSLLSFGGDALLLFFEGTDHQRRAAHAAAVMKRKPAELGPLQTTVGPVRLKLSMGAHSGRYLFLVSGVESRVVLLLGPDVTTTARLEQRASGGQVMIGPSLAAAVPEAAGPLEEGAALLRRTPRPPLVGDPHPMGEPRTPPERFLAPPLRTHIATRPTSEHRPVAVGFVQLRGTDALIEQDPIAAFEAVDAVVVATQQAAAEFGVCLLGSDVDADGAKLILVAGAPVAEEHSEERLLRTCRAVLDIASPLQLRAGVTSGHVFVGDVGPSYRRAFTVMGERVNLAARLMASAAPGELRTTPRVIERSGTTFSVRELEPLVLKGIAEPVAALAVGSAIGQLRAHSTDDLLGRDDQLATLQLALARAVEGHGSAIELIGEPGIGKTALLAALVAATELPALRAGAVPYEADTPFGLVRRIIRHVLAVDTEAPPDDVGRALLRELEPLEPHDLALLLMAADAEAPPGDLLPDVVQDELLVTRLARAVRRALSILVQGPGLLVVEDLQWADPLSAALLTSVAEHLPEHPWLLCASRRPAGTTDTKPVLRHAEVLPLFALDEDSCGELVHRLTPETPQAPHRVAAFVERSGGNPLFLTELVRLSKEGGELPESVEAVVNARLDALPGYLRKMLRQAAVLGARFDLDLLDEVAGFVPDREEWRVLEGLLRRTGSRGEFASEMYRDVAYHALPFRERRELHRTAGRLLQARGSTDVELLALHAAQAHDDELTWTYAVEAGVRSLARGAHEKAVTELQRALIAHAKGRLGEPAETLRAVTLLGDALVRAGRAQEALPVYRRARLLSPRGLHGDPVLAHKEALARIELSQYAQARRWLKRGLDAVAGPEDESARHAILESQAGVMYRQGQYGGALRTLDELVRLTEGTAHRRSNAHAHDLLHLVLSTVGDPRSAEHRTQAVEIYQELADVQGLAKAYNNLGTEAYRECRWDDAVRLYEQSRRYEEQDANDVGAAISDANISEVLVDQGGWDEALVRLTRALRTFQAEDFSLGVAEVRSHLGLLHARRGAFADAEEQLEEARHLCLAMGADSLVADLTIRRVELAVMAGEVELAEQHLDALDRRPDAYEGQRLACDHLRAVVLARRGQDQEAADLLREVAAAGTGTHLFRASLARHSLSVLLTRLGSLEAGEQRTRALESLRSLGVHQFRDPLAGDEPVVVALPSGVMDLTGTRERAAV